MLDPSLYKAAQDFLESIPAKHAGQIVAAIDRLCADPYHGNAEKLKGFDSYY